MGVRLSRLRDPVALAVGGLAVHRLTRLVVEDEITRPLREAATERWARRVGNREPGGHVAYLLGCPWCVSMYVAAGWAVLTASAPAVAATAGAALAWSSVTGLLSSLE